MNSIPYNITGGFVPKVDLDTVVDDYGRRWNGNNLTAEDLLFTQCYGANEVNLAGMLTAAVYVKSSLLCCKQPWL